MPPPVTTSSFENMQVMQGLLNKEDVCVCVCVFLCVGNFLEAAQYVVVAVQSVKIFTKLCPNDSSFESNRLLFAHIPSPGYPKQISVYFVLK